MHNELHLKDKLEAITPKGNLKIKIVKLFDHKMQEVAAAHGGHPHDYYIQFDKILEEKDLIRTLG